MRLSFHGMCGASSANGSTPAWPAGGTEREAARAPERYSWDTWEMEWSADDIQNDYWNESNPLDEFYT